MTKIVKKALSDVRLSAKQKRQLKKLAHRPDSEIDFSDITRANALLRAAMLEDVSEKAS